MSSQTLPNPASAVTEHDYASNSRPKLLRQRGLGALLKYEAKLFLREPAAVFFGLFFPTVLFVGLGLVIPGMQEMIDDPRAGEFYGIRVISIYAPISLAVALATVGLTTLPPALAIYRETKVLRRLATTPMRPQGVFLVHVLINGAALVIASVLSFGIGSLLFEIVVPKNWGLLVVAYVLAALAIFGIGLLIAATARKGTTASAVGMLIYFPMLFFAGVWSPGPAMNSTVELIAKFTPMGAGSQALTAAWFDGPMPWVQLAVMFAYAVVCIPLAVRLFRSE